MTNIPEEYLETFRRIWEAIREELRIADVRVIRSRRQAIMKLQGERSRLLSELERPEKRFVEAMPDFADKGRKVGRLENLENLISRKRKFAGDQFNEFVMRREEYMEGEEG